MKIEPITVTPKSIQTNIIFSGAFKAVFEAQEALKEYDAFVQGLICRNAAGELSPEEQAAYNAWYQHLVENSYYEVDED